jgi:hypothetical protein
MYVRFAAIAAVVGIGAFVIGIALQRLHNVPSYVRSLGSVLEYAGVRFAIITLLYGGAGVVAMTFPDLRKRKFVAIAALVAASIAFLFIPICWNPRSDDCRSIVTRLADGLSGVFGK